MKAEFLAVDTGQLDAHAVELDRLGHRVGEAASAAAVGTSPDAYGLLCAALADGTTGTAAALSEAVRKLGAATSGEASEVRACRGEYEKVEQHIAASFQDGVAR